MSGRSIRWTERAVKRLGEIGRYIEKDNPTAAARVISRIVTSVETLAQQPARGRTGRIKGTRELVLADVSYIVPYRIMSDSIEIITVIHTAQRWPSVL